MRKARSVRIVHRLAIATAALIACALCATAAPLTDPKGKTLADMPAGLYQIDKNHTHLYFTISHVGFSRTHGRFDRFEGTMDYKPATPPASPIEVKIQTASIDMNVPELENVLRSAPWFDATANPEIVFVSKR